VPTNFAASATSSSNIALSWTASTDNVGVANYEVRRDGTLIGSPTGASFNDSGRTASTTYSYTILAVDAAGNTSATASASATTRAASSSSSSSGGGGGGGGRFDILTLFVALALLSIQVQRRKRPTVLDRAA
jgi:chitodextrinase